MPYKNPEARRQYDRERRRLRRAGAVAEAAQGRGAGTQKNLSTPTLASEPTVADVLAALAEQLNAVLVSSAEPLAKARAVGYLAGVLLRGIETGDLAKRLEALEEMVEEREAQEAEGTAR